MRALYYTHVSSPQLPGLRRSTLARDRTQLRLDFALRPEPAAPPQARPDSVIADGSSIMTQEKEYGASFQPPTPDASVEADAVEESTGRQGGLVKRMSKLFARGGRSGGNAFMVPHATAGKDQGVTPWADLASGNADELWVIQRPSGGPVRDGDLPGSGCLMATVQEEEVPVPLEHTDVDARIDGYIASVVVRHITS